jgi:hypothetical protein
MSMACLQDKASQAVAFAGAIPMGALGVCNPHPRELMMMAAEIELLHHRTQHRLN